MENWWVELTVKSCGIQQQVSPSCLRFFPKLPITAPFAKICFKKIKSILVENGKHISVLFIIPVVVNLHGHRFQMNSLVSETHKNVDVVLE